MAGLSPTELKKRNNFSLFKQRITNRQEFTLTEGKGQKVKIDHRVAGTISSIDDLVNKYSVGKSIILPTAMGQQVRLTQLYKDAAFVGRTQSTTAAEDYQVKVIRESLAKIKDKLGTNREIKEIARFAGRIYTRACHQVQRNCT